MFVNRRLDNSDPLAKISPEIMQKIEATTTTIGVATSNNTPDTIVKRDGTGSFSAGTVKATGLEVSGSAKLTLPIKDSAGVNILDLGANSKYGKTVMPNLTTGTLNLGIGEGILPNGTTATANTYIGYNVATSSNSSASYNTAVGESALRIVGNNNNTAVGHQSMRDLTSGTHNTAIGMNSGYSASFLTTGSQNTLIGALARLSDGTSSNATAIGYQAQADGSNTVQLGNTAVATVKTSGTLYALGLESIGTNSTLSIASANNTNTVNIGSGSGVQTINLGNTGAGATVINIGGAGDTVNISGTLNNVTTTNTQVQDSTLVLNSGGTAATAGLAGIYFEEAGNGSNSYMRVSSDRSTIELKAPLTGTISLNQSLRTTDSVQLGAITSSGKVQARSFACSVWDNSNLPASGYSLMAWNRSSGSGRATFACQQGGGTGGWEWLNFDNTNSPSPSATPQMTLDRDGNLVVLGTASSAIAPTAANHLTNKTYVDGLFPAVQYHSVLSKFAGPYTIPAGSQQYIRLARIGTVVTATVTGYNGNLQVTNATLFQNPDPIPEAFRPYNSSVIVAAKVTDNGVSEIGTAEIRTDGMITIGTSYEKSRLFTSGGIANFNGFTVSYVVL